MHYYNFNIGDYQSHTKHLTPIEDICYRRLLDHYYLHEQPLPNDIPKLTRLLLLNGYVQEVENVLTEFFELTDSGWINHRANKEIQNYQGFSEAGKRGAAKRWSKGSDSPPIAPPKGGVKNPNSKQETINKNHETLLECLNYLNQRTKKNFKPVETNLSFINARLNEGYSKEDIFHVVDVKVSQWLNDPRMSNFLRPETLFNATKFSSYVAEKKQERGLVF